MAAGRAAVADAVGVSASRVLLEVAMAVGRSGWEEITSLVTLLISEAVSGPGSARPPEASA
jgi:hypothetical protein